MEQGLWRAGARGDFLPASAALEHDFADLSGAVHTHSHDVMDRGLHRSESFALSPDQNRASFKEKVLDPIRFQYRPPTGIEPAATIDLHGYRDDDVIVREIRARNAFFELDLLEHILLAGPRGGVYLDVGANIGNHAVYFGRYCADRVVAVEPHPALVPILRRNLEQNCPRKFTIQPVALSDEVTTGRMTLRRQFEHNIGGSQVEAITEVLAGEQEPSVPITTLDRVMETIIPPYGQRVSLMKVDVEGMELQVFRGGRRLLEQHRPQIVVELATEEARQAARAYLAALGYQDSGLRFGWTPTYHFIDPSVHKLRSYAVKPRKDSEVETFKRVTEQLLELVPAGQPYIFVDQEEWRAGLTADGRKCWPFTEREGVYWGPPTDDAAALQELQRLHATGARCIVFAAPAFWWLDYYKGLAEHLRRHHRLVLQNERLVAYELI